MIINIIIDIILRFNIIYIFCYYYYYSFSYLDFLKPQILL